MNHSQNSTTQWRWSVPTIAAIALMAVLFGYTPPSQNAIQTPKLFATLKSHTDGTVVALATVHQNNVILQWRQNVSSPQSAFKVIHGGENLGPITFKENNMLTFKQDPNDGDILSLQDLDKNTFATGAMYSLKN